MFFFHLPFHVLFLFSLYTYGSYYLYAIYYFCFTQRCLDEFCLKCFRNTGCQSLLAINSLLAKFFKSLYYDWFYCIQQVNISWVVYDFSHMFICLLWFCHGFSKGEMCFIWLGGVLTSFFLYTGLVTMFTYIVLSLMMYVFLTYLYMCCFFYIFMHMLLIYCMQFIISISH